jgi:hypothetical protein
MGITSRFVIVISAALVSLASSAVVSPGLSAATGCGQGTVYDAPSDSCLVAAPPTPSPPPPGYGHGGYGYGGYGHGGYGYGGDLTPGFSVCLGGGRFFWIHACI